VASLTERSHDGALAALTRRPDVRAALKWIGEHEQHFVDEVVALSEIPAPSFAESRRAAHVVARLHDLGVEKVELDQAGNVIASTSSAPSVGLSPAFMAHLDTVFPEETPLDVSRKRGRLYGPGIGDNSAGLAGLLLMVEAMRFAGIEPSRPLWLVASTCEEGLGDLRGARAAMASLRSRVDNVVAIEGALLGRITHEAVGSLRWQIDFSGPGGHSWHDFGRASAINAAAAAVGELARLDLPVEPRTTYNVGRIEGGIGVNVIAANASMLLDMRSVDAAALSTLAADAELAIHRAAERQGAGVSINVVGNRPAGSIPRDHHLVNAAAEVLRWLQLAPRYESASTDANIPLSNDIPAITIGITHGGGIHTEDEWIEIAPAVTGIRQLLLLALILSA
jgi:acetylornithine deacetylase/succinyl-diaminopimelate desuccinylase-like protein